MGARPFIPLVGRFMSVDPVPGGSANDYDYSYADPINKMDIDGNSPWSWVKKHKKVIMRVVTVATVVGLAATGVGVLAGGGLLAAAASSTAWGAGVVAATGSAALCGSGANRGATRAMDCLGAFMGGMGTALGVTARSARMASHGLHAARGAMYAARARAARTLGFLPNAWDAASMWASSVDGKRRRR
jgi:hypothetical protein